MKEGFSSREPKRAEPRSTSLARWWLWALVAGAAVIAYLQWPERFDRPSPAPTGLTATGAVPKSAEVREPPAVPFGGARYARVVVELNGPERIQGGTEFTVVCRIGAPDGAQGWVELRFDPGLLTLADASTPHDMREPGLVRLFVSGAERGTTEVQLQFMASFSAPAPTILSVAAGEFISPQGRPIGLGTLPSTRVAFVSQ